MNVTGSISAGTTVTCQVQAHLFDGSEMVASLSFQPIPCCGNAEAVGPAPTFDFADASVADAASADGG